MVEFDETMQDLATLYEVIGGNRNYEIWDKTAVHGSGLEEITAELGEERSLDPESRESTWDHVDRLQILDYWHMLNQAGLMDDKMQLTEFGEQWAKRTRSSVQSLYMSNADIGEDRKKIGDIFYTLGAEEVLPTLHLIYEKEDLSEYLEPEPAQRSLDTMFNHGFLEDDAYRKIPGKTREDVLTDRAETVYNEVVESDYDWLKVSGFTL